MTMISFFFLIFWKGLPLELLLWPWRFLRYNKLPPYEIVNHVIEFVLKKKLSLQSSTHFNQKYNTTPLDLLIWSEKARPPQRLWPLLVAHAHEKKMALFDLENASNLAPQRNVIELDFEAQYSNPPPPKYNHKLVAANKCSLNPQQ